MPRAAAQKGAQADLPFRRMEPPGKTQTGPERLPRPTAAEREKALAILDAWITAWQPRVGPEGRLDPPPPPGYWPPPVSLAQAFPPRPERVSAATTARKPARTAPLRKRPRISASKAPGKKQ